MSRKLLWVLAGVLVAVLFAQAALAQTIWPLREGDTGLEVRVVQVRLYTLGYLAEEPQEPYRFNAKTKKALTKFQTASGLAVTGTVDETTYDRVKQSTAVTYDNYKDQMHVKGGSGEEVKETKTQLKKLGYFTGALSELYDEAMVEAVAYFQRAHGLPSTGKADKATRTKLFSSDAMTVARYRETANLVVLKKGDSGQQVTVLQKQLSGLGYYEETISGSYGVATVTAVKTFQTANELKKTGAADVTTRELLNSSAAKSFGVYTDEQKLVTVSRGDTGYAVQLLQDRLKALSYYAGSISGTCGDATVSAVKDFQQGNGLVVTGVASSETRTVMNRTTARDRVTALGLRPGDDLPAVQAMTTRLKQLGFMQAITSKYADTVTAAVKLFQKANKLTATGNADLETLEAINDSDAVTFDEYKNGSGNAKIEQMITIAYKHRGKPYKTGSACDVPNSFDCSRYTAYVFAKMGVKMSGEVASQGNGMGTKYGKITSEGDLRRGDLLYFDTQPGVKPIGHSAIYLGKVSGVPKFIHASSALGRVDVSEFSDWYRQRFLFGVRVWN